MINTLNMIGFLSLVSSSARRPLLILRRSAWGRTQQSHMFFSVPHVFLRVLNRFQNIVGLEKVIYYSD